MPVARKMATPAGVLKPQVWRTETLKRVAVVSTVIVAAGGGALVLVVPQF